MVKSHEMGVDSIMDEDEEIQVQRAAVERLPDFKRLGASLFDVDHGSDEVGSIKNFESKGKKKVTDVTKLGGAFIEKLIMHIENDNLRLLQKLRERMDRVNVKLPTVEVRCKNLFLEADCEIVQGKPLPTLWTARPSSVSAISVEGQKRNLQADYVLKVNTILQAKGMEYLKQHLSIYFDK